MRPENFRSTDVVNNLVNNGYEVINFQPKLSKVKYINYSWYNIKSEK